MGKTIDACGLTCPAPVLLVKDAVEQTGAKKMTVLVDNGASLENVERFLTSQGYEVTDRQKEGVYTIEAQRSGDGSQVTVAKQIEKPQIKDLPQATEKNLVLITNDCLGTGDDQLGKKLMVSYIKTIKEMGPELWQLIFVNGGVKLTTSTSPVLKELQEYEKNGVIIFACGTCLEHFGLTADKKVGGATNMLDIVSATQLADKVINIG